MSKGSTRRPGTILPGAWEAIFNINRMEAALQSPSILLPAGLSFEQARSFILEQIDPDEPCRPQCGDCGGTRRVKGEPCPSCAPTDADDMPID